MCGRFVLDINADVLKGAYGLSSVENLSPRFNIAPSQLIAAVRAKEGGGRELAMLKWGLIPPWAKDANIGYKMINARSETAHEKPSFRHAYRSRRCIIPASGFFEWEKKEREKVPHYIHRIDGKPMSMAGLWERWAPDEGDPVESCTILTTSANDLVSQLHDRMPVILDSGDIDLWLDPEKRDIEELNSLMKPVKDGILEEWSVSTEVNTPRVDDPKNIQQA